MQFFERHRDYRRNHSRLPEWWERRVVEACFTLDAFVARFAAAIRGAPLPQMEPLSPAPLL